MHKIPKTTHANAYLYFLTRGEFYVRTNIPGLANKQRAF